MIRLIAFLVLIAALALGLVWLADRPGDIALTWQGYHIETSVFVGLAVVIGVAVALAVLWRIVRIALGLPGWLSFAARARRRNKGYAALSRGMIAAGAGDTRAARKAAAEAAKHLPNEPLSLLLKAQAAQLAGDRAAAETVFSEMAQRPETRLLGLRGLHMEAARRGDVDSAQGFALQAHRIAALPWAGAAVLDRNAARSDWEAALRTLDANVAGKITDKAQGERLRAVLETALAQEREASSPDEALRLARQAAKRAPGLVPAVTMAARLMGRKGDTRKAAKLIEAAWRIEPHPDLAQVFLDLRPGDSNSDRLARARYLEKLSPGHLEGALAVGRAALAARDFAAARAALATVTGEAGRPTARACLLMAEIEEAENGATGRVREWLARASRAPRDAAWIADGVISDKWLPASPVTDKLDAFVWRAPDERLAGAVENWTPLAPEPPPVALPPVIDESGAEETPVVISAPAPKPEEKAPEIGAVELCRPARRRRRSSRHRRLPLSRRAVEAARGWPEAGCLRAAQGAGRSGAACGGQTGVRERADAGARIALTVRRARLRPPPGSPRYCRHRPAGRP
jgi:HemY protein